MAHGIAAQGMMVVSAWSAFPFQLCSSSATVGLRAFRPTLFTTAQELVTVSHQPWLRLCVNFTRCPVEMLMGCVGTKRILS